MALIIDIETVGEKWTDIDPQTQKILTERITRWHPEMDELTATETAQTDLGFSPLTGEIVALGVVDDETGKGAVYYQAPNKAIPNDERDGIKLVAKTETELLTQFWQLTERYTDFVTFSGRTFDVPFIMIRSAIKNIRPTKDLMRGRYLYQSAPAAVHIDLYDQLSFYGAVPRLGGLHLACRAFGIETPKDGQIDGAAVGQYFADGKYQEIAAYNARDLHATSALYKKWRKLLSF